MLLTRHWRGAGDHMGIGNNQSILWHDKPWSTGQRYRPTKQRMPAGTGQTYWLNLYKMLTDWLVIAGNFQFALGLTVEITIMILITLKIVIIEPLYTWWNRIDKTLWNYYDIFYMWWQMFDFLLWCWHILICKCIHTHLQRVSTWERVRCGPQPGLFSPPHQLWSWTCNVDWQHVKDLYWQEELDILMIVSILILK